MSQVRCYREQSTQNSKGMNGYELLHWKMPRAIIGTVDY